jgi:two-component system, OmpR family, sensor kinase
VRGLGWPRRLLTRVLLHGVVLLVLAWGATYVTFRFVFEPAMAKRIGSFLDWTAGHLPPLEDPEALRHELEQLRAIGMDASVYDAEERLVASSVSPAVAVPAGTLERVDAPLLLREQDMAIAAIRKDGRVLGYLVTARAPSPTSSRKWALLVGLLLGIIALASLPLARSIARPLTHLREVARRLGESDLSARAELRGGGEIGDLARSFNEMADRLELARRAERELLANISHELRTPLSRIRVVLEIASEGDAERARKYLPEIAEDLGELERLVSDVMETARLELSPGAEGLPPLRREILSADELVERSVKRLRAGHAERALSVESDEALADAMIDVDPKLMSRALDNLLDNAQKYSDAAEPIEIEARVSGDRLEIDVLDRGVGIAPEDLPHVFRPFFRGDRSRARETGGMGLGLSLAQRILTAHGGKIEVGPRSSGGTRATMSLPLLRAT